MIKIPQDEHYVPGENTQTKKSVHSRISLNGQTPLCPWLRSGWMVVGSVSMDTPSDVCSSQQV